MATKSQKPAHTVAVVRNQQVVANVPQHQLLKLDLPSLILVAACMRGQQKDQKAAQVALVEAGVIIAAPGNNKTLGYSAVLVAEAKARAPQVWEAAKATLIPMTKVPGEIPSPETVSQMAEEAKEVAMSDQVEFPQDQLLDKKGNPLTGGALQARLVSLRSKAAKAEPQPVETKKEAPIEAPKEEVMKSEEPSKGALADQIRKLAPTLGVEVKSVSPMDWAPSITAQLHSPQYGMRSVTEQEVRDFIAALPAKKTKSEGQVLGLATAAFRARLEAKAKKAKADNEQRVAAIQAAVCGLYQTSNEELMKLWREEPWAGAKPMAQSVALLEAEKVAIESGLSLEEALPALQDAAQEDAKAWILALKTEATRKSGRAQRLANKVNSLSPDQAREVMNKAKLGGNPQLKHLRNFFVARAQGAQVKVSPSVYREALKIADQLHALFNEVLARLGEEAHAQAKAADKAAEEVIEAKVAEVVGATKATIEKAVQEAKEEAAPEAPKPPQERSDAAQEQEPQEPEEVKNVVEEPKVVPKVEVTPEQVKEVLGAAFPDAEVTAEAVQPNVEVLKGFRALNAFFKRQADKLVAKKDQFTGWVAKKEPKKPTPRALRRETQVTLEEVISMQPKEGNAFLELKEGSELSKAVQTAFEQYVSMCDAARVMKGKTLGLKTGTKASLAKGEYPKPVLTAEMAWALEIALKVWKKRTGLEKAQMGDIILAFREIKGLPGRETADLAHIVVDLFQQLYPRVWSADQFRVLEEITNAKEVGKVKLKDGSYISYYSYHAAVLTAKGLFGFVMWAKLPFRAAIQLVGGSAWNAITAKKGARTKAAKEAVLGAWEKVQQFGWVLPKSVVTKAWAKIVHRFAKKTKTPEVEQKVALETKGQWERAVEGVRHTFNVVREATAKVVEAGKADKSKPIGAAVGGVLMGAVAFALGAGVITTTALVVGGLAAGWFAKRAFGWVKGRFSKKAEAPAAETASASA